MRGCEANEMKRQIEADWTDEEGKKEDVERELR